MLRSNAVVSLCVSACAASGCGLWVDAFAPKPDAASMFDASVDAPMSDAYVPPVLDSGVDAHTTPNDGGRDAFAEDAYRLECAAGMYIDERVCRPCETRIFDVGSDESVPSRTITARCPAGEVAVGFGIDTQTRTTVEGLATYVTDFNLLCAPVNAGRTMLDGPAHVVGMVSIDAGMSVCPSGQVVAGFSASTGEILDVLGALCQPLRWSGVTMFTQAMPVGGTATPAPIPCPEGQVVVGVEGQSVSYYGADIARGITAICEPLACL